MENYNVKTLKSRFRDILERLNITQDELKNAKNALKIEKQKKSLEE